ncbi:MAG TPA: pentapeptide repeat-containing protein, partial [Acidothermaceae bacterium]|nr:pentapeptide repeat-containing protein [Acidothermaceae bacterium]
MTFAGADWRAAPHLAGQMFDAFAVMRQLHELLWFLTAALSMPTSSALRHKVYLARETIEQLTVLDADSLVALDVDARRNEANTVLLAVSEHVRAGVGPAALDHRGARLIGASLPAADLTGANLRGALLIGADLTAADLTLADVTGADVRDTDFSGA